MSKNLVKNLLIGAAILGIIVIPGIIVYLTGGVGVKTVNADKLGSQIISFINTSLLSGKATSTLDSIKKESGVYKLMIKIDGQESTIYATLDGKLLFPSFIPIEQSNNATASADIPKTDKPDVQLFVMAFCPYGNQAEDIMKPVVDLLGGKINLTLHYIVSKSGSTYSSLHGDQELHQDVRELCVAKYQKDKLWAFVEAINKNCTAENADTCWKNTASGLGIDTAEIESCYASEGNALLDAEIALTSQYNVQGSPQVFVNGKEFAGDRSSDAYKTGICSGFTTQPSECQTTLSTSAGSASGGCNQ